MQNLHIIVTLFVRNLFVNRESNTNVSIAVEYQLNKIACRLVRVYHNILHLSDNDKHDAGT